MMLDTDFLLDRARAVFALISGGDPAAAVDLIHAEYCDPRLPPGMSGPEGFLAGLGFVRAAFPDWTSTPDALVVEGDRVGGTWTARGTHLGSFFGVEATGRAVEMREAGILTFREGRLVAVDRVVDQVGLMSQIGANGQV